MKLLNSEKSALLEVKARLASGEYPYWREARRGYIPGPYFNMQFTWLERRGKVFSCIGGLTAYHLGYTDAADIMFYVRSHETLADLFFPSAAMSLRDFHRITPAHAVGAITNYFQYLDPKWDSFGVRPVGFMDTITAEVISRFPILQAA